MAASLLGTTGNWGIPSDEAGIIITDLSFDFSNQEKPVMDKGGEIIGLALFQEKIEIKLSGLVSKDSPFAGKIGAALTLANAIPENLQASGGTTILMQLIAPILVEGVEFCCDPVTKRTIEVLLDSATEIAPDEWQIFRATDTDEYWLVPLGQAGSAAVKIYPQGGDAPLVSLKLKSTTSNSFLISGSNHTGSPAVPVYHPTLTHHNQYQRNFCGYCVHDPDEVSDPENTWNAGSDIFIAPRTGNYRFTWSALRVGGLPDFVNTWGDLVWGGRVALRINGSADYAVTTGNLDGSFATPQDLDFLSLDVALNAGDTVQIVTAFGRSYSTAHLPPMHSGHHDGQYGHRGPLDATLTIEEL